MDTKGLRVQVKDADAGEVEAVFATFGVIDSDGDVTATGAFDDGAPVRISAYGHKSWEGNLPVGKGTIRTTGTEAILAGRFFLDTAAGRDTFTVVKELDQLQEWSYGYDAVEYSFGEHDGQQVRFLNKLKVHEVSPVLLGAGVGTRTLSAKSGQKFGDEANAVLAAITSLTDRAADVLAKRQEKGKGLGEESSGLLEQVQAQMKRLADLLTAAPETPPDEGALQREYLRYLALAHNFAKE